jgi:sterol 24-C-methyltransferase
MFCSAVVSALSAVTMFGNNVTRNWSLSATTGGGSKDTFVLVAAGTVGSVVAVQLFTSANPLGRCYRFWKQLNRQEGNITCNDTVNQGNDDYLALHREQSVEERSANYAALVNAYYDLATVFYEWGWGSSFHFSYQYPFESFAESIRRHEHQLAAQLGVYGLEKQVLDVGCGIGGPMRTIAKFLQCRVQGITLNHYQVARGNELTSQDVFCKDTCKSIQGDFMHLPQSDCVMDAAYAIEATCHAPDRVKCYSEIYRVLKPGAVFACYEWCMTDKYDAKNPEHLRMKKDIEEGNGLPDIIDTTACLAAMKEAGFEIINESDLATVTKVQPWETPLTASWNPLSQRFQFNWLGGHLTNFAIAAMETLWIAPKGTVKTQKVLQAGGFALRDAGQEGIFTTMYLMVGRKPANGNTKEQ